MIPPAAAAGGAPTDHPAAPKATVAKRTSQRACRLGLHTVAPPPSQPLERRASLPEAIRLGLRNQTCTLSPGLGLGLVRAGQDCTTAMRRPAAARTERSRGALWGHLLEGVVSTQRYLSL